MRPFVKGIAGPRDTPAGSSLNPATGTLPYHLLCDSKVDTLSTVLVAFAEMQGACLGVGRAGLWNPPCPFLVWASPCPLWPTSGCSSRKRGKEQHLLYWLIGKMPRNDARRAQSTCLHEAGAGWLVLLLRIAADRWGPPCTVV